MTKTTDYLKSKNISYTATADGKIIVNESISIDGEVTLDDVIEVGGYVYVRQGATLTAPALAKCGYVYVRQGATLTAPALAKCGYVYVRQGATLTAPALAEVGGSVYVRQGAMLTAPALAKCGYVYVQQGASFAAPELDTVDHVACEIEFLGHKIKVFDGIGCVVSSEKTRDGVTIRSCRKSQFKNGKLTGDKFYVASKDGYNSHAATIAEAGQELAFKTGNRDIEQYRNMPKNTKKSPKEWAFIYRMVTGACQYGTNAFMAEHGKMKKAYTLTEILSLTKGRYGHDTFKKVVGA